MKTESYLTEFLQFSEDQVNNHKAVGDHRFSPGTISFVKSYFEDLGNKIQLLNTVLVDKGNEYLAQAKKDGVENLEELKSAIFKIGKDAIKSYVAKNKPK